MFYKLLLWSRPGLQFGNANWTNWSDLEEGNISTEPLKNKINLHVNFLTFGNVRIWIVLLCVWAIVCWWFLDSSTWEEVYSNVHYLKFSAYALKGNSPADVISIVSAATSTFLWCQS